MSLNPFATNPSESNSESKKENQQDLSSLLSQDERADLTLLVAAITQKMQKQLADVFETSIPPNTAPNTANSNTQNKSTALKYQDSGNVEVKINEGNEDEQEEKEEERKLRKSQQKREKELSAPEMQELKKESLAFFQQWQDSVISRIGEAVNARKTVEEVQEKSGQVDEIIYNPADVEPKKQDKSVDIKDIEASTKNLSLSDSETDPDAALINLRPPTPTPLLSLTREKRILLLHAMLLILLSLEHYASYSRLLLLDLASTLHLPLHILRENERNVAQTLAKAAKQMTADEETQKRGGDNQMSRRWKVGLAGVAGAAIIGITGGLAAPLVAAGIGTVMGGLGLGATAAAGLLGTLAESGVIVGALFGAYGGRMTGKMMDQYAKEVEDFAFLPLSASSFLAGKKSSLSSSSKTSHDTKVDQDINPTTRRLRVTIGISGWLTSKEDIITPWRILSPQDTEPFSLRWELAALLNLGTSIESVIKSTAWSMAKKELISRTIFASLMSALWPLSVLKIGKIVDNPFSVAKSRADKAGLVLADAIINKAQGERPITLVGYSLGARVIYSCLISLAQRRAFGLVESAVLIGAPCPSDASAWRAMRSVVASRLVNVYSEKDLILAFLYRTSSVQLGVAGLQRIDEPKGVENVDVSSIVTGHMRYQYLVGVILEKVGWEDLDTNEVAKEAEMVALLEKEEAAGKDDNDDEVKA